MPRRPAAVTQAERTEQRGDFVDDLEIARRWNVSYKIAQVAIRAFEGDPRFPQRDPLFGGLRYWPAVENYVRNRYGLNSPSFSSPDGPENLNAYPSRNQRRARPNVAPSR